MSASGTLTIVATPIGNLGDFTPRAAATLAGADVIACEDTRTTRKLLRLTGTASTARMVPYHDHNGAEMRPWLLEQLEAGRQVALVSDAGTPLVSDPGYKLVAACRDAGITVVAVPGASAVLAALTVSGLPSDRFMFAGFLPAAEGARRSQITELAELTATTIWFETPARIARSLTDMADILGPRDAIIARELTKLHEEILRGTLDELAARLASGPALKGEIVLLVAGRSRDDEAMDDAQLAAMLRAELEDQRLRDAVKSVVEMTGLPRNRVYRLALELTGDGPNRRQDA
ncbi:MAG: 16S rRNA (cytidine(1402)-2'-O)-methyltransferase [Pseudomonadota bacterium]|nr:16S rRNA (cytidine(1402)-2'-O)-methyltransferase [Pseudomonadota bacterium]MEC8215905.1 16S rRNA (cytidine(1402)-2'-O)-methyltransferase [Pseudomonadota bacterium]MEC8269444.1 16S rRNA (cytidine(1402)-2'-O)-methyltransferase [Pseudomonadota bacterium]